MKKIVYGFFLLVFLNSCKDCASGKEDLVISFTEEGIYSIRPEKAIFGSLTAGEDSINYGGVCLEIQNPDVLIIRFVAPEKTKDISMRWSKLAEGKYRINYKDKVAYFYSHRIDRDPKDPDLAFMLSLKDSKPVPKDTEDYVLMTRIFNYPTLDYCAESEQRELNTPPDPGPENNWGKDK
ncbi:hypothetical protein CH352_05155 [Leptospira hartskeerlii]|uniref:Uncharacterized protein n=1 Tax=Leptospira hartskeerlii TaxID=2023177 RepID=A0A2M9XFT1_9LEPT|nr:hypothetical protein [Leptospira hartskeerlii]PJZ26536.1 hypothetical protein CH357_03300 [Leptospira hartskeerlii]PJZ34982.1 hypothetical protein CH352_05155 [Leptospira hartskeerlii]